VSGLAASQPGAAGHAAIFASAIVAVAAALAVWSLAEQLPPHLWLAAALHPAPGDAAELVFSLAALPRLAVAAMAGAALAASGAIIQHVLRNPLASPVTLGVSSGAQLALVAATLGHLTIAPDLAALGGGIAALAAVLAVASARRFSSLGLLLAGLSVSLFLGSLGHALKLFNQEYLASVLLWSGGALAQDDWSVAASLFPRLLGLGILAALLTQSLRVIGVGDEIARGLGVSTGLVRVATLGVAVGLAAVTTAAVGMIGFVEIAAPLIARLAGARGIGARLALAPPIGAGLLVIVDTLVQALARLTGVELPTGAATAFLAAPLLLILLPRMRGAADPIEHGWPSASARAKAPRLVTLAVLLLVALALSCLMGRVGAQWSGPNLLLTELPWRLPRALAAFAAGAMLGGAGALLQRATGNALAGPEVIGVGAAAMAGFAVALLISPAPSATMLFGFGAGGAAALTLVLAGTGWRARFAPDHLLLTGVALAAALDAVVVAFLAANDGRARLMLQWLSGSTAGATWSGALGLCAVAAVLTPLGLLLAASLDVLPLGDAIASGLGVAVGRIRLGVMLLAALLTSGAVLIVGPLTFVGLLGPHVAWRLGFTRSAAQLPAAALIGGLVMILADWLGRVVMSPFEIPTGLVAALVGCPYLILRLCRDN
jgi:ABC-type Fe3+-siderophore transport system permease subunit